MSPELRRDSGKLVGTPLAELPPDDRRVLRASDLSMWATLARASVPKCTHLDGFVWYTGIVKTLEVQSERRTQLIDVTAQVRAAVAGAPSQLVTLFVPHTTAGIAVQAAGQGAAEVASDVEAAMERLVVEEWPWRHTSEGDRNPWSHVRAILTASSLTLPVVDGDLGLGRLQAVFLCEFDGPRTRNIQLVIH